MIKRFSDERGLAMVTGLMISMIVLFFAVAVVGLSMHNSSQSARDRKRVDAISTAEGGLNVTMDAVQTAVIDASQSKYTLPCTVEATLPTTPPSSYSVTVNYYATYPPSGDPMACPPTTAPGAATFTSTGSAVAGSSSLAAQRSMEAQARLTPVYGGFGHAIFSDQGLDINNHLGVSGHQGNDGDLYTNGNLTCSNNSTIAGSAYAQGTISLSSSCTFNQDVYAKLSVSMINSALAGHDAISSTSSLSMSNTSHVNHNATVASATCSGCSSRVSGTITLSHVSPPPPVVTMPQIDFIEQAWVDAGFEIQNYTSCTLAHTAIAANLFTKDTVVRIKPACTLTFSNDKTMALKANLAIVADGPITFANLNKVSSANANKYTFYLIEPTNGISNPDCTLTPRDITVSNQTVFTGIYVFSYSQCKVTFNNNNDGVGGQIIGGQVDITNLYDLAFQPIIVPGGVISGFKEDLAFTREIVNPTS